MSQSVFFKAVGPIGDTDKDAIPVKGIGPAVGYYTQCLGFSLVSKDQTTAKLRRDDVQIGLAVNGQDPEQASCWFSVLLNCENLVRCARFYNRFCGKVLESRPSGIRRIAS